MWLADLRRTEIGNQLAETAIEGEGYAAIDRRSANTPNQCVDLGDRRCILAQQGIRPVHGGEAVRNTGCPLRRKAEDRSNIRQERICDDAKRIDLLVAASVKIPWRRQDADVARVADFLRGVIRVFAAVEHPLRHQMRRPLRAARTGRSSPHADARTRRLRMNHIANLTIQSGAFK
jgi:hypothetical protein